MTECFSHKQGIPGAATGGRKPERATKSCQMRVCCGVPKGRASWVRQCGMECCSQRDVLAVRLIVSRRMVVANTQHLVGRGRQFRLSLVYRVSSSTARKTEKTCLSLKRKEKQKRRKLQLCSYLHQWFSTFLTLRPFNTIPHVVVTPIIKLFCYYFITVTLLLLGIVM